MRYRDYLTFAIEISGNIQEALDNINYIKVPLDSIMFHQQDFTENEKELLDIIKTNTIKLVDYLIRIEQEVATLQQSFNIHLIKAEEAQSVSNT